MFISKIKFTSCFCILTCSTILVLSQEKPSRSICNVNLDQKISNSKDPYVNYAFRAIQQSLALKTGSIERVSCTYKFSDNKPISVTVKTHYIDYRKKPDCREIDLNNQDDTSPDYSLEVIYRPSDKNHLALIAKDPTKHNKRLESRFIEIPTLRV
jgi:hypothetical protein